MFEESVTSIPSIWASMNSWFTPTVLFLFLNLMIGTIYVTSSLATQKPTSSATAHPLHHHQIARSPSVLQRLKSVNFYGYRSPEPNSIPLEKTLQSDNNVNFNAPFGVYQSPLEEYHQNQSFISRSPSVLQRIKSSNLYNYFSQELPRNQEPLPASSTITTTHFTTMQDLHQEQEEEEEFEKIEEDQESEEEKIEEQEQEQTLDEIYSKLKSSNQVSRSKSDTKPTSGEVPKKLPKKMMKSASSKSAFSHFEEVDMVESRRPATVREGKDNSRMTQIDDDEVDAKADDFINKFKQQLKLQRIDSIMRNKKMVN